MTLAAAISAYRQHAELHSRPRTWSNRRSLLRQLAAELGAVELAELDASRLEAYTRARLKHVRPVSVNSELRALGALRSWAKAHGERLPIVGPLLGRLVGGG